MKRFTPLEAESTARNYVDLLRQGKFEQIANDLDPSIADSKSKDTLSQMAAFFPAEVPESVKVVDVRVVRGPEYSTVTMNIDLEYQFADKWLLVNVATQKKEDVSTIVGFHVRAIPDSLENLNRFTLTGKGAAQYFILAFAICSVLLTLYVLVLCLRTKSTKKKWLWALFILLGVCRLAVNWTTGDWSFTPLSIALLSASATCPLIGPWTVAGIFPWELSSS